MQELNLVRNYISPAPLRMAIMGCPCGQMCRPPGGDGGGLKDLVATYCARVVVVVWAEVGPPHSCPHSRCRVVQSEKREFFICITNSSNFVWIIIVSIYICASN